MSKRLQVILDDAEYRELQRLARKQGTTISDLVREALRTLRSRLPLHDTERKLAAIRQGARHSFPAGSIDQMLKEIEEEHPGPPNDLRRLERADVARRSAARELTPRSLSGELSTAPRGVSHHAPA